LLPKSKTSYPGTGSLTIAVKLIPAKILPATTMLLTSCKKVRKIEIFLTFLQAPNRVVHASSLILLILLPFFELYSESLFVFTTRSIMSGFK
jgi:hypothetical protein